MESKKGGIAGDQLRHFIERIEKLEEEKATLAEDIREVYKHAKYEGFEIKIMRKVISMRKMDQAKLQEEEHLLDLYKHAMGMIEYETA